jgi:putative salt-induced outer membrane protein YdiY
VITCVLASQPVLADQINIKNGDRLTGQIIKSDGKTLTIKTEYGGEITIPIEAIDRIASDQTLFFALSDGKTVSGTVATKGDKFEISTGETTRVEVERADVQAIRSQAEQNAYERLLAPGWFDLWAGAVDVGYSLTTGNTRTSTFSTGATATRETRRDKTGLYLALIKAEKTEDDVSETTANALRGGGRYEINLTDRLAAFGSADFEHNEIQLLDLRMVLGGGLGYYLKKSERSQFQVFGGGAYNYENFSTGITRNSAEALAGEEFTYKISDRVTFNERMTFFPNLSDTGEYRINFDSALVTRLNRRLSWQLVVSDRYLSNPVSGSKSNDLLLTTGVSLTFNR